jgi:Transcriptional regulators
LHSMQSMLEYVRTTFSRIMKEVNEVKPKYQIIIDDIKSYILSGTYKAGEKIPSELALQEDYNVSRQTVRKAILELSNEGFLRSEKGSGTYVSSQYRSRTGGKTTNKTIGVITTYISDYIFPSIIRGIESRLNEDNYSLLLASTNNDISQEKKALEMMLSYGVDGLIIEPTRSNVYNPNIAYYLSFKEQEVPLTMINAYYEELEVPFFCLDDVQSSYLATRELIAKGHTQIGIIAKMDDLQGKYRMKGFIKALGEAKLRFQQEHVLSFDTATKPDLSANLEVYLNDNRDDLTALVCYNDEVGLEVVNVCRQLGISIPDELSIIGQDNSYIAKNANIKLTTLTHPQEQMGRDAADWIIKNLQGKKDLPTSTYYQPLLIEGETVKAIEVE